MTIRTLLVDDEPVARQLLRDLLADENDVDIVGECADGAEAIQAIEEISPDLVFLDVQMPEADGFEVLEALDLEEAPAIIFATAHDEFALRAFDANAVDYVLKPLHSPRVRTALARARRRINEHTSRDERLASLVAHVSARVGYRDRVAVRSGTRVQLISIRDIDWIGADGNYARLYIGRTSVLHRQTMSRLEQRLDPSRFTRIHRSVIVNIDRISEVKSVSRENYIVVLDTGARLTSGASYRKRLGELIAQHR